MKTYDFFRGELLAAIDSAKHEDYGGCAEALRNAGNTITNYLAEHIDPYSDRDNTIFARDMTRDLLVTHRAIIGLRTRQEKGTSKHSRDSMDEMEEAA